VRFAPAALGNILLATSWDGTVGIYDAATKSRRSSFKQAAPVLAATFQESQPAVFAAGLECALKRLDLATGAETVIGRHEAPVRSVEFDAETGLVVSGSWDCTARCWDPRSHAAVAKLPQPFKVFGMTGGAGRLVVATAHRTVNIYQTRMLGVVEQRRESSLKYQTRCVSAYPNGTGYALSSVEGRVAMEYYDTSPEEQKKKYAFKCHRKAEDGQDVAYPVNAIAFHPQFGTFTTGGCDGLVNCWDGSNKKRLHQYPMYPTSISAMSFSSDGSMLAVASSYTFEEGDKEHPPDQIYIRSVQEGEVKPKPKLQPR